MNRLVWPRIVSFCGAKFAGKGTSALLLVRSGYLPVSFARPLKDMLVAMGLSEADVSDPNFKEKPHPLLGGKTPRLAMQLIGTEWGRNMITDNIWVNVARKRILDGLETHRGVVVDDCRFANEAVMLRELGSKIIEITKPGCSYNKSHASEAGLPREMIDATISNDSTIPMLEAAVSACLSDFARL